MDLKGRVGKILEGLELATAEITFPDNRGWRILVAIVSPSFEAMDEGERQALVLGALYDGLGDYDSRQIEFVFTDAPGEVAEAIAQANAAPEA